MSLRTKLLLLLGVIGIIGLWPHDLWHETVYYSDVEGSRARVIVNRYPPPARWVNVELLDFPTNDGDWLYENFSQYDHRVVNSIFLSRKSVV